MLTKVYRRRAGEVARAELFYYINRKSNDDLTEDVLSTLSEQEKLTLKELSVFMVPGKLLHSVPILLTKQMKKCVELIISCRAKLNVSIANKLLFPRVFTENPFDGSKIIRELRETCHLKRKTDMTSTGLRHHVATKTQIYGNDGYTENVCQFLGHTQNVHKQNYRLPIQAIQRGQVGHRLLEMEEGGTQNSFKLTDKEDPNYRNSTNSKCKNGEDDNVSIEDYDSNEDESDDCTSSKNKKRRVRNVKRKRWAEDEKEIVLKEFEKFITAKQNPGKHNCLELIRKHKQLSGRTWTQINVLINNVIKGKIRLSPNYSHISI